MEHVSFTSLTWSGHCGPHLPEREPMHVAGNRVTLDEMVTLEEMVTLSPRSSCEPTGPHAMHARGDKPAKVQQSRRNICWLGGREQV
jgi:hypothetical protein